MLSEQCRVHEACEIICLQWGMHSKTTIIEGYKICYCITQHRHIFIIYLRNKHFW